MMKGIFDGYYQIDIVSEIFTDENDVISYRITYSELDYPDFYNYVANKILTQKSIFYKDEEREGFFLIISISIAKANKQSEHLNNKEIPFRQDHYGNILNKVPVNQRKDFLISQYYGTIKMKRK
ncbi:hypothetical protein [Anaerotignum sp.]